MLLWTQSASSYSKQKQEHDHKTVNQKVNIDSNEGKEAKMFLFKVNLNWCRQNIDYKSIPSLSFPFFIPLGPCSKETQAGPSFFYTRANLSAQEAATGQLWWVWLAGKLPLILISFKGPEADLSEPLTTPAHSLLLLQFSAIQPAFAVND